MTLRHDSEHAESRTYLSFIKRESNAKKKHILNSFGMLKVIFHIRKVKYARFFQSVSYQQTFCLVEYMNKEKSSSDQHYKTSTQ